MQAADIIIDTLLSFNRPVHEQELICEVARRGGLKYEDMFKSATSLREGFHELCNFGYLQETDPGWYTIRPLDMKSQPLRVKKSEFDYRRMCEAYLKGSACNPQVGITSLVAKGPNNLTSNQFYEWHPETPFLGSSLTNNHVSSTSPRTIIRKHIKSNKTVARRNASTAVRLIKYNKTKRIAYQPQPLAGTRRPYKPRTKTSSKIAIRQLRGNIKAPTQLRRGKRIPQSVGSIEKILPQRQQRRKAKLNKKQNGTDN
ncbi:uncharacterized protein LOC115630638 [Scaptodrosophila lebanonensis]|uniref:Uncharacterized protein LOC115630638 n=1 Tax=Drosophila lebanonensis TaxID=7225 RepID=A0A6J2U7I9_DROLE|nr:uncharacterized protein LOC115630638 [Scaptodrosophila lebanonensis]XP_030383137.1 uncharacterized protein LOC115630638 [Scaptodrosophila lebanonensis]